MVSGLYAGPVSATSVDGIDAVLAEIGDGQHALVAARTFPLPDALAARFGIVPDWVEGPAFARLAHARLERLPGNVATVTGARPAAVLGGVH